MAMPCFEVKLKPVSPIQSLTGEPQFPSSSTIFGAICWGIRAIWGKNELKELLADFIEHKRFFFVSSAFPYFEMPGYGIRFFPVPKFKPSWAELAGKEAGSEDKDNGIEQARNLKRFKEVKWLSEELFAKFLSGQLDEQSLFTEFVTQCNATGTKGTAFLVSQRQLSSITAQDVLLTWRVYPAVRNSIDRLTGTTSGAGEFFYDFRLAPAALSSFFLLKARDIEFLKPVLRYLEDTGIGGERSIGLNRYKIQLKEYDPTSLGGNSCKLVTLSRWRVDVAELNTAKAAQFCYELIPYRRKLETGYDFKNSGVLWGEKALYFAEGSVLVANQSKEWYGRLWQSTKIGDEHIMDYGIAFPAFFREGC